MCAFQLFVSVDPSLSRLDYSLLSDQTLMEMLIEGFDDETKKKYQDGQGVYLDICEWPKIKCGEDESVIEIDIDSSRVAGSAALSYVPPKVKLLWISSWSTEVHNSELTGSVDFTNLPDGMSGFIFENNRLTGEINLTHLPGGMKDLRLTNNQISGTLDLTHLPDGMKSLSLASNHLTGEIDLTHLPDGMGYLYLQNNQLSGPLVIQKIPSKVKMIDLEENHFNAVAVVDSKTRATIKLKESGVTSVLNENGRQRITKYFFR